MKDIKIYKINKVYGIKNIEITLFFRHRIRYLKGYFSSLLTEALFTCSEIIYHLVRNKGIL